MSNTTLAEQQQQTRQHTVIRRSVDEEDPRKLRYLHHGLTEPQPVVVADTPIMSEDPITHEQKPISFLRIIPTTAESCIGTDVQLVKALKKCGWWNVPRSGSMSAEEWRKIVKRRKTAMTPRRVAKFLVAHLSHIPASREALWLRLFGSPVPNHVATNHTWRDISSPNGNVSFDARFWTRLFRDVECMISFDLLRDSKPLALYSSIASQCGIDHTRRIFPFMFLESLLGKNFATLIDDDAFLSYMYCDGRIGQTERATLKATLSALTTLKWTNPLELEDAWTMLICSSFFRGRAMMPHAIKTRLLPNLRVVMTRAQVEDERRRVAEERAAAERVRFAALLEEQQQRGTDIAIVSPQRPTPTYGQYGGKIDAPSAKIFDMISAMGGPPSTGTVTPAQTEFVRWCKYSNPNPMFGSESVRAELNRALANYALSAGYSTLTDPWTVQQSAVIALFGGDDWTSLHETVGPFGAGHVPANPAVARNAFARLSPAAWMALFRAVDNSGLVAFPRSVSALRQKFLMVVGQHLKSDDVANFDRDYLRMLLSIYYRAEDDQADDRTAWTSMWTAHKWTCNQMVTAAVEKWKALHPVLPPEARAEIMAAFSNIPSAAQRREVPTTTSTSSRGPSIVSLL